MGAGLHDSRRHGRKETTNDPRGTQARHRLVRSPCHAGGRPARPRGRTRDHGWPAPGLNAVYALVQTALVQDEALKRADARIREPEDATQQPVQREASFLGSMREAVRGPRDTPRAGSVPSVRPAEAAPDVAGVAHHQRAADVRRARLPADGRATDGTAGRRLVPRQRRRRRRRDRRLAAAQQHPQHDGAARQRARRLRSGGAEAAAPRR